MGFDNCWSNISLIIAGLTLVCNVIMIIIMKKDLDKNVKSLNKGINDLNEETKNLNNEIKLLHYRFDNALERAKTSLIYEEYFPQGDRKDNFSERVISAYEKIKKLIPVTDDRYRFEDWLLAEWLVSQRGYGDNSIKEKKERIKNSQRIYMK